MNITTIFFYFVISFLGSFATYKLSQRLDNILSSTIITLTGSIFIILLSRANYFHYDQFLYCLYGASFVGMSDSKHFNHLNMLIATFSYFLYFLFVTPLFGGLGGALGFTALLAMIKAFLFKKIKA